MNRTSFAIALALFWAAGAPAQRTNYKPLPPFAVPDTIEVRHVDIYSEGVRISGQLFSDKASAGKKAVPEQIHAQMVEQSSEPLLPPFPIPADTQNDDLGFKMSPFEKCWPVPLHEPASLYLRYGLSLRNLEELMAERDLNVDHVTIWRWVQRYAPELNHRCRRELRMTNRSWRVDETYRRVAARGRKK